MFKVIGEFGGDGEQSLLLSMPQSILKQLEHDVNGEVSLGNLLAVLRQCDNETELNGLINHVELMDLIYNSDRAVDEKALRPRKKPE